MKRLLTLTALAATALGLFVAAAPSYEGPPGNPFEARMVHFQYLNPSDKVVRFDTNLYWQDGTHQPYLISHELFASAGAWDCLNTYCTVTLEPETGQPVQRIVDIEVTYP